MSDSVTRYVPTYVGKDGMRTLMLGAQGRYTFATREEAQRRLDDIVKGNNAAAVAQIYGSNPQFEVRPVECWPGHFDPKGIYFD